MTGASINTRGVQSLCNWALTVIVAHIVVMCEAAMMCDAAITEGSERSCSHSDGGDHQIAVPHYEPPVCEEDEILELNRVQRMNDGNGQP